MAKLIGVSKQVLKHCLVKGYQLGRVVSEDDEVGKVLLKWIAMPTTTLRPPRRVRRTIELRLSPETLAALEAERKRRHRSGSICGHRISFRALVETALLN